MSEILSSEWQVLFCVLGLTLAAALCGFGLGMSLGRALERRRAHREEIRVRFDPMRVGLVEVAPFARVPGEPMTTILKRHAKEAGR